LQQEGSLKHVELLSTPAPAFSAQESNSVLNASTLPATIRDAMIITQELRQRFLWIDTLCIVQDDDTEKQEHLRSMGSIYANAYITIVAAEGTAYSGIFGINHGNEATKSGYRRQLPDSVQQITSFEQKIRYHHQRLRASLWNQRAWTFQEQIFSRRLLVFTKANVS